MVAEKHITIEGCEIYLDTQGFLILEIMDNAELDLDTVKSAFKSYEELGIGPENKVLQIIISPNTPNFTREARDYAAAMGKLFFKASAVVGSSLATRIIVNFFNKFYKHEVPFRMFETETGARTWLLTHK